MSVLIETTIGDLVFDLYIDKRPKSCLNFLKLCKIKYYNFCLFHSIRRNFIAQCGDPTGTGRGGESVFGKMYGEQAKYFELEIKPKIKHQSKGTISFVNNGNNMHGSQFFITLGDGLDFLDGKHTVFGKLTEGFETLEKLNETICDESHRAYQDVRISHTIVLDDPFDDPKGLVIQEKSPEPTQEQLDSGRIRADEDLEAEKAKPKELIEKEIEDKELKIGTKILETIGDIGDAEEKPPENVLFVCKLNHVTNEEDLKIIFSRFGKILSCEIIKDQKTGDSLCYGFIEFKEVESCERAYFKMDNVLIDDRRIHVDFCQSLAKIKKFHKNAMQKFSNKDDNSQGYKIKHSKAEDKKYSMIFDDESSKKSKTNKPLYKPRSKRDYSSESDSDSDNTKKRKKLPVKPKVKRKSSTSSSDDHRSPSPKPKKKFRRRSDSSMERISGKSSKNKTKLDEKKPARKSYDRRDYSSGDDELIRRPAKKKFNESFNKNKKSVDEDRRTSKSRRRSRSRESNRSPSRGKRRNRSTSLDNKRNYSADRKKKTQASKAQQKKRAPSSDSDSDSEPREEKLDKKRQSVGGDQKDKKSIRSWDDDSYAQKGQSRRGYSSEEDAKHTKDSMKKSLSKADTRKSRLSDDDLDDTHRGSEKTSSRVLKTQSASKKKPSADTSDMDYSDYDSDHGGHRDSTKKQKQKSRDTPPPIPKVPGRKSTDRNNKKDRGGRYSDDYSSSDNEKKFNNKKETPGKVPFSDDDEATAVRRGKATTTTKKQTTKTKERIGDFPNSPKSASRKKTPRSIRRKPTYSDQSYSEEEKSSYKGQKKGSALSSVTKTKKKSRDDRSDTEDYAKSSSKKTTTKRRRDSSSSDESFSKRRHSSSDAKSKSKRRRASPPPKNLSRARKYSSSEDDASRRKLQRSKKTRRRSSSRSVSTSD